MKTLKNEKFAAKALNAKAMGAVKGGGSGKGSDDTIKVIDPKKP